MKVLHRDGGWSQDDRVGACGVQVSSKLWHLPGTAGGPGTLKVMGRSPMQQGRMWGRRTVGGKVEAGRDHHPWGMA